MTPTKLYKYRTCDKFTKKMLTKGQLYLCPANKLDDQFDCAINFSKEKILNLSNEEVNKNAFKIVEECLKPYIPNELFSLIMNAVGENGFNQTTFLGLVESKDGCTKEKTISVFNQINQMTDNSLQKLEENDSFKNSMLKILELQMNVGVCSLAERKDNQVMWNMYSHNYEGYCIEYDTSDLLCRSNNELYKVEYKNKKKFDPIEVVIKEMLNQLFSSILKTEYKSNLKERLEKIVLRKHSNWKFQKEWRIMGIPNGEIFGCKINAVYLGKNINMKNEEKIVDIAKSQGFKVYKTYDDFESLSIKFKRLV